MARPSAALKPPPPIPDHELIRQIGQGSYGEVWLARNVMGAYRAVKLVYRDRFESDRPFEREFAGIQRYEPISRSADGLVQILHVGRNPVAGSFYYVMELADDTNADTVHLVGGHQAVALDPETYEPRTLRHDLERLKRLPVAECVDLGLALAAGLAHLHRHGLVHRDLKPANIIFVNGRAKLADLGLVGEISGSRTFVGTEGYIPPEGPGTPAADVFGLGRVLYEASTGLDRERFPELPDDWLTEDDADGALEFHEISLRAGEGNPDRRYRSAAELQADLALLQSGQSVRRVRQLERRLRRLRRAAVVGGLAIALTGGGLLLAGYRARIGRENFRRAEQLRIRAETAEQAAREELFASRLARAAAEHDSGRAGSRATALEELRTAAKVHPDSVALRSIAATILALPDVTERRRISLTGEARARVAADPSAARYARVEADGTVSLRSLEDDVVVRELERGEGVVSSLWGFSGDGRWLGGLDRENHLLAWNVGSGQRVNSPLLTNIFQVCDFVTGKDELAIARAGGRLDFVSLPAGVVSHSVDLGIASPWFSVSPDARHVAVTGGGRARLLNATNGAPEQTWSLPGLPERPAMAWNADSRTLALTGDGFDLAVLSREPYRENPLWLRGHSAEISSAAFSPDGRWLASSGWDSTTRIWDPRSGRLLLTHPEAGDVNWSTDSQLVRWQLGENQSQSLVVLRTDIPQVCRLLAEVPPSRDPASHKGPWIVETLADGRVLAVPSYEGVRLWDLSTGAELAELPTDHATSCNVVADPPALLLTTAAGMVRWPFTWDAATRELHFDRPVPVNTLGVVFVAATALEGRRIYGSIGSQIFAWEAGRRWPVGEQWGRFPKPVVSPDGQSLVITVHEYAGLTLRSGTNGAVVRELTGSGLGLVGFSPDNRWLAISSGPNLRVEEVATGKVRWRAVRSDGGAHACPVLFSPDGSLLAAEFDRNEVGLFEAATGRMIVRLVHPQPELISSFAFTPDGSRLAVACPTHVVQVWDLRELDREQTALGLDSGLSAFRRQPAPRGGPVRVTVAER